MTTRRPHRVALPLAALVIAWCASRGLGAQQPTPTSPAPVSALVSAPLSAWVSASLSAATSGSISASMSAAMSAAMSSLGDDASDDLRDDAAESEHEQRGDHVGAPGRLSALAPSPAARSTSSAPSQLAPATTTARPVGELIADGRRLFDDRQIEAASALFLDALRLAEQQEAPGLQAQALLGLGRITADRDHLTEARQTLERALTLFTEAGDRAGHAQALVASGLNLYAMGEATEAARRIADACDTLRTAGDADSLARAFAARMVVMPPGPEKDRARDQAFAAARASSDRSHECAILQAWGGELFRAGDLAGAYRRTKEAASCYEPTPRQGRLGSALTLLGDIERAHGQFETALAFYRRALDVQRRRNDPVGTAASLNAVGMGLGVLWRLDEARVSFEAALALAREVRAETFTPYLVGQLGAHFAQAGKWQEAVPLLKESLNQAPDRRSQIDRLTQLGTVYARMGDVRAALEHCDRAVTLARPEGPTSLMHALRSRAEARRLAGNLDGASADLREGIDVIEGVRRQTVPIDFMKRGFSEWHQWLFGSSIALSTQRRDVRQALETAERARGRAFLDLLATRALSTVVGTVDGTPATTPAAAATSPAAAAASSATGAAAGAPPAAGAGAPTGAASGAAATTSAPLGLSPGAPPGTPSLTSSQAVPAATMPEMIAIARRLRSTLVVYWAEVDATFIWVITPEGRVHDTRVDIPLGQLASLIAAARPATGQEGAAIVSLTSVAHRRPWRELYDRMIKPVRAYLPRTPGALLTIVPHGPLFQLSFAALEDERGRYLVERYRLHYTPAVGVLAYTDRRKRARGTRRAENVLLVGDPGELPGATHSDPPPSALPWARREVADIAALLATPPGVRTRSSDADDVGTRSGSTGGGRAGSGSTGSGRSGGDRSGVGGASVGGPGVGGSGNTDSSTVGSDGASAGASAGGAATSTSRGGARTGRVRPGTPPTVLIDTHASETEVRANLPGRTLLHFATHGIVRQDEALSSFLALRGQEPSDAATPADDGRLTANEVYDLQLDADLVVLSACSSALGPMTGDGVIGFTRAFLSAGAASVIATTWDIPDAASYALMSRFYRARHDGAAAGAGSAVSAAPTAGRATVTGTSRALRAAQLATIAALRQGRITVATPNGDVALPEHPLLWAGYLLVGEP